jgi:ribosomal protein S18 acetylase RimI-like enzyme
MHSLRLLTENDAADFWAFRLAALEESPQSFEDSADDFRASPVQVTAQRLRKSSEDNFVLGAFVDGSLAGTVGFFRNQGRKTRHKGRVWGVYVVPQFRGKGIGRSLMEALVTRLRKVEDLRQVSLGVATTQVAAMALYESMGFRPYGIERSALRVDGHYVDEEYRVLMLG